MRWPFKRKRPPLRFVLGWCDCGAPLACDDANRMADCADIIRGTAIPSGQPGALRHCGAMPYVFWKIKLAFPNVEVRREPRNQP